MSDSFGKIGLTSLDDLFKTDQERQQDKLERVLTVPADQVFPYARQPYSVDRPTPDLARLMDSIERSGIAEPMIVRPRAEGGYEIISGHRRDYCARELGLDTRPVIVREYSDEEADILVVDANINREDLLPSEKARAYKLKLDAMKRQAGRPSQENGNQLGPHLFRGKSKELLSEQVGESTTQIQRYVNLTRLIPTFMDLVDSGRLKFVPAADYLSHLSEQEQTMLLEIMERDEVSPSMDQAKRLKGCSMEGHLDDKTMNAIMGEEKPLERKVILHSDKLERFFPKNYTPGRWSRSFSSFWRGGIGEDNRIGNDKEEVMEIKIYQINMDRDTKRIAFESLERLEMFQGSREIDSAIYDKVFQGEVNCAGLEDVFKKFNLEFVPEFAGHSLSVSDIVEVVSGGKPEKGFYFCDSVGFEKVEFHSEQAGAKKMLRMVLLEPGKVARDVEIDTSLFGMQRVVQGKIERYTPFAEQVCIVTNEEGKNKGLDLNRAVRGDDVAVEMSYPELAARFRQAERDGTGVHLTGRIVFTEDSFPMLLTTAALLVVMALPASALEYNFTGPDNGTFARPTSEEITYVTTAPAPNHDVSKNVALVPPAFGNPTSYLPFSGKKLTPNLAQTSVEYAVESVNGGVTPVPPVAVPMVSTGTMMPYTQAFTATTSDLYYSGGYLGTLSAPSIGLSVRVYQGTDSATLAKGAGHFTTTSVWDGNVAIAGHNRGVNNHFGKIHTLETGDRLTYTTQLGIRTYEVYSVAKVSVDDTFILNATGSNLLTLVTCVMDQPAYRWCVKAVEVK